MAEIISRRKIKMSPLSPEVRERLMGQSETTHPEMVHLSNARLGPAMEYFTGEKKLDIEHKSFEELVKEDLNYRIKKYDSYHDSPTDQFRLAEGFRVVGIELSAEGDTTDNFRYISDKRGGVSMNFLQQELESKGLAYKGIFELK